MFEDIIPVLFPILFPIAFIVIALLNIIFPIWAIVDCVKTDFKNPNDKIVWILVILLFGCIGSVIYLWINDGKRKPDSY